MLPRPFESCAQLPRCQPPEIDRNWNACVLCLVRMMLRWQAVCSCSSSMAIRNWMHRNGRKAQDGGQPQTHTIDGPTQTQTRGALDGWMRVPPPHDTRPIVWAGSAASQFEDYSSDVVGASSFLLCVGAKQATTTLSNPQTPRRHRAVGHFLIYFLYRPSAEPHCTQLWHVIPCHQLKSIPARSNGLNKAHWLNGRPTAPHRICVARTREEGSFAFAFSSGV